MKIWQDLRSDIILAFRHARCRPAFAFICIGVLALGLGAATANFSLLYQAALKPLPYPGPDRLVAVHNRYPQVHLNRIGTSPFDFADLTAHHELFSDAGVYYFLDLSRTGVERPRKVNAVACTASLFRTLGASPILGRNFNAAEGAYHGPRAVILSEAYWEREFARDPDVLDRDLELDGNRYRIVGVLPRIFQFPNAVTEMWTPATFDPSSSIRGATQPHFLRMYARLAPGLNFAGANARIEELSRQLGRQHPADYPVDRMGWSYFLLPMARDDDGSLRRWLAILFAAASCLLLIVCANVAGLLAARSAERRFELSIRLALGASRWRVARQALTEVSLLAIAGGLAAWWIAEAGVRLIARYKPIAEPQLDPIAYWFLAAASIVTGLLCGLPPAWMAMRTALGRSLKEGGQQRTASPAEQLWRYGLIVGQVALATTLLVTGGLLLRSLQRLLDTPPGFDAAKVLTMEVSLPGQRYPSRDSRSRFLADLLTRIRQLPGVESASACTNLPFGYGENVNTFHIVGQPPPAQEPFAVLNNVMPDYFHTMRIPLLRGRAIAEQDRAGSPDAVVIDATLARQFFGSANSIGQRIRMGWGEFTIVGVAGSIKMSALEAESKPLLYFSALQWPSLGGTLLVRSALPEDALVEAVQRLALQADKDLPVYNVSPLQTWIDKSLAARRLVVLLTGVFAGSGMLLAALGLYGALSYMIALRRREIGIRMVLGADAAQIAALVARTAAAMAGAGLAIGAFGALAAHRVAASQLYATSVSDGLTWLLVCALVAASCALACALPAWRAIHVDPAGSLRES